MTKEKEKKIGKDQLLLEASRLGQLQQLETILSQMQHIKSKKKTNPLASLRKTVGPNSVRDPVTGFTCLHHASLNGHSKCVELILNYGAKLNAVDYKGSSALHLAAWAGNVEVVRILLNHHHHHHHSENNHQEQPRNSPSDVGGEDGQCQKQASSTGANSNTAERQNSPTINLHLLKQQQHSASNTLDIDLCNNDNQTPLSLAAQFGHSQVVAELLAHGANVYLRNSQLESPLDLACLNGRLETVDLLLRYSSVLIADLRKPQATIQLPSTSAAAGAQSAATNSYRQHSADGFLAGSGGGSSGNGGVSSPTARRPSAGGWSSLLRGRRDSSSATPTGAAAAAANQQEQSPLHRLTSGTLSMRQKHSAAINGAQPEVVAKENQSPGGNEASRDRRRATLTVGAPLSSVVSSSSGNTNKHLQQQQQQSRQSSLDVAWMSNKQNQMDSRSPFNAQERLLDHSPLHYAVRRGHGSVVNLLLGTYQANILQTTTMGSVLHEIALNNGKHSDMIRLLFSYVGSNNRNMLNSTNQTNSQTSSSADNEQNSDIIMVGTNQTTTMTNSMLDKFLNLKNAQQKNVFEVLNEINNRSAQEIKRLIYEFSEQLQLSKEPPKAPVLAPNQTEFNRNLQTHQKHQQPSGLIMKQQNSAANTQAINCNNNNNLEQFYSSQQQQQFSDSHMLDSFVTMKRAQKHKFQTHQNNNNNHLQHQHQQQQQQQFPGSTQTINRRQPALTNASPLDPIQRLSQFSQQQQEFYGQQLCQQQAAAMTRSVSNLSRAPAAYGSGAGGGRVEEELARAIANGYKASPNWNQWNQVSQQGADFVQGNQKQCDQVDETRRRRSRSRDLGSLLLEAQQSGRQVNNNNERLYDNNVPPPNQQQPTQQAASIAQLVRSQTDCSHLMGRFFGDQSVCSSYSLANATTGRGFHPTTAAQQVDPKISQQHHNQMQNQTLDRKAINRHYHVYEHEFYPPRLLKQETNQQQQKQAVAVVQPLGHTTNELTTNSNGLRASIRSTASSCASAKSQPAPVRVPSVAPNSINQQQYSNSRLSLNIEPPPRRPDGSVDVEQYQQQMHMDRFLSRHSRKSQLAATNGCAATDFRSASVDQHKKELLNGHNQQQQQRSQQQRLIADSADQQQTSSITNSISLESHLSEPHLFESTRRALLHDFDQMIGRELLNRDHRQIIEGNRASASENSTSMLTGVMLDMDRRGERLTVSGTRITIPQQDDNCQQVALTSTLGRANKLAANRSPSSLLSNGNQPNNSEQTSNHSPLSVAESSGSGSTMTGGQTKLKHKGESQNDGNVAPPKPPRLSLLNKASSTNTTSNKGPIPIRPNSVIYDLPANTKESSSSSSGVVKGNQPISKRSQTNQQVATKPPKALTDPPKMRPPPPPEQALPPLATPLHLSMTSGVEPTLNNVGCCSTGSSSTAGSSICGGSGHQLEHNNHQVGLLKMANSSNSGSSSSLATRNVQQTNAVGAMKVAATQQLHLQQHNHQQTDPDSGVCTSNSPASMSHDSEEQLTVDQGDNFSGLEMANKRLKQADQCSQSAVVRHHLTRASNQHRNQAQTTQPEVSPPSPKTAQLCIEEALLPLAKPQQQTSEAANQTSGLFRENQCDQTLVSTSTSNSALCSSESLFKWLEAGQQQQQDASKHEADYENCQLLQRQLRMASCQSIGELLANHETSASAVVEGAELHNESISDPEQVSNSPSSSTSPESSSSSSSSMQKSPLSSMEANTENDDDDYADSASTDETPSITESFCKAEVEDEQLNSGGSSVQRKEVLLKVVVDESEQSQNGDEVFYMNPSELKKIAIKRSQADAETLTDEELCAAIDKESGYIRFTLRKRRNNSQEDNKSPNSLPTIDVESTKVSEKTSDSSTKVMKSEQEQARTFINSPSSCVKRTKLTSAKLEEPEQQEVGSIEIDRQQVQDQTSVSSHPNKTITPESSNVRNDLNNNNNNLITQAQKQQVLRLKNWFATNLAGLVEYSDKFIKSGFDDLKFLNNPELLNEQLLSEIGIDNESHRTLIMNRITQELPPLEMTKLNLLPSPAINENEHKQVVSHIVNCLSLYIDPKLLTPEADLKTLRELASGKQLSLGHRTRLNAALDLVDSSQTGERDKMLPKTADLKLTKASSTDDGVTTSEFDIASQVSAVSSSSSSKESIKSIVSLSSLRPTTNPNPPSSTGESEVLDEVQVEDSLKEDSTPNEPQMEVQEQPRSIDSNETTDGISNNEVSIKSNRWSSGGSSLTMRSGSGSLVSEVARRLEAVAAQKVGQKENLRSNLRPVAAVRRINCKVNITNQEKDSSNASTVSPKDSGLLDLKAIKSFEAKKTFVPVKSVCWPPPTKNNQQQSGGEISVNSEVVNKLQATRSIFMQRISSNDDPKVKSTAPDSHHNQNPVERFQQQSMDNNVTTATKQRPKPAPPAKPAKLAANKQFNIDLSQRL